MPMTSSTSRSGIAIPATLEELAERCAHRKQADQQQLPHLRQEDADRGQPALLGRHRRRPAGNQRRTAVLGLVVALPEFSVLFARAALVAGPPPLSAFH